MRMMLLFIFLLVGCGDNKAQFETYDIKSSGDLVLTRENHAHGFGENECFFCHVQSSIHMDNRINSPLIELARTMTRDQGESSCSTCHGSNGL